MTTIGKILAVVVFFAAVIFMAVASSVVATSYPWRNHTQDMTDFTWGEEGEGENFKYTVSWRQTPDPNMGQRPVPSSKVLPQVIIGARKTQVEYQKKQIEQLENSIKTKTSDLAQLKAGIEADLKGLDEKAVDLKEQLVKIQADLASLSEQNLDVSDQIGQVRVQEIARRKDVTRLKALYDVVLADKARLESQRETLQDTLYRLTGTMEALERRNGQLRNQLGLPPLEQPTVSQETENVGL